MAKTRPPYTPEFRRQMVELVHAGRSPEELAQEFEPTAQSIRNWVGQAQASACCACATAGNAGSRVPPQRIARAIYTYSSRVPSRSQPSRLCRRP
jgi:transposase-like protein